MPNGLGRPWRRTVARVIRRDAGICWICGQPGADTADHVIPRAQGGPDTMDNLRAAHHNVPPYCNRVKGNRTLEYAVQAIALNTDDPDDWDW